jgi:PhzF family phenazine biosynthesis protein
MGTPIYQVDAFTSNPFEGNPAGVCLLDQPAPDAWMQSVAREMNLSETAFIYPIEGGFHLRWFTPLVEVDLCGHATLGTAHVLFEMARVSAHDTIRFSTRSGWLSACLNDGWIMLDFPAKPVERPFSIQDLAEILGVHPIFTGMSRFDWLVEVQTEQEVREAKPDFSRLKTLPVRGVIVTSRAESSDFDFVSRFFAPAVGVDEDPVTGSAHCVLAPYWAEKLGKVEMTAHQISARGGILRIAARGERVEISGQAVTVIRGELTAEP